MTKPKPKYTIVPNGESITPLQSAMAKLSDDSSKSTHLSPRECAAVLDYIGNLETDKQELNKTLQYWERGFYRFGDDGNTFWGDDNWPEGDVWEEEE